MKAENYRYSESKPFAEQQNCCGVYKNNQDNFLFQRVVLFLYSKCDYAEKKREENVQSGENFRGEKRAVVGKAEWKLCNNRKNQQADCIAFP